MKRWFGLLVALLLVVFAATPAFAQEFGDGDDLCIGGNTRVASNETTRSVVLFGCGARIASGAHVLRDVVSFGGDVVIEEGARIDRDIVIFGGTVDVSGRVGRGITMFGGRVILQPGSVVERDVLVFGGSTDKREGAVVRGSFTRGSGIRQPFPGFSPFGGFNGFGFLADLFGGLVTALALAALGALILVFLPTQTQQVSNTAAQSAVPSLGVGCLTWLIAPPLIILFVLTCLGIPLAAILGILLAAAAVFGWIAVSLFIGEKLLRAFKTVTIVPIVAMLVGLLVLWLLTEVPILGGLITIFVASLALGAVVLTRFAARAAGPA
ncbi:MAG: hypothetical protein HY782_13320 [Chloroflexi bacterium]|nr:hypothetical protein [Chloroflexota bacterium]